MAGATNVIAHFWAGDLGRGDVEIEPDEGTPYGVALHTMIDGTGSHASYYFDRESALQMASRFLEAAGVK